MGVYDLAVLANIFCQVPKHCRVVVRVYVLLAWLIEHK